MIRYLPLLLVTTAIVFLTVACSSVPFPGVTDVAARDSGKNFSAEANISDCPVTQPPKKAFIPPDPWPAVPPDENRFWFGDDGLWTALPKDGSWRQLALGEKFWWWSDEFDVTKDETPDLVVTARRLDGEGEIYQVSDATNGYHPSFNWAMLIGVELPSPGCWEFTGQYNDHELTFVLSVP